MMDEQKLADIRARCKAEAYVVVSRDEFGGRHEDECWQATADVSFLLRMIDQQQAENQQLKHRLEQEWDALYSVLPDPDNAKVSAKGAVILACERLKAQQAVIAAAHSVRRIPAHKDGPGHDMALESLYDALDAMNGTEPDAAGSGER